MTRVSIPHQSFLGILCYLLFSIILLIGYRNIKLTHFLQSCKEMYFDSNKTVPPTFTQVSIPTVAQVPVMPTVVPIFVSHGEKPEKFNGLNFKRWQHKMLFYPTTLNLARFLTEEAHKLKEDKRDIQVISVVDAWKHYDFLCRNYVMNALIDYLYNVYSDNKLAKELCKSLDRKYKIEDVWAKKFVVGRFLYYKMVDSKTVVSQV